MAPRKGSLSTEAIRETLQTAKRKADMAVEKVAVDMVAERAKAIKP